MRLIVNTPLQLKSKPCWFSYVITQIIRHNEMHIVYGGINANAQEKVDLFFFTKKYGTYKNLSSFMKLMYRNRNFGFLERKAGKSSW